MTEVKNNRLAVLAADIRTAHEEVCRSSKLSAERAVDAGRWLDEAKVGEGIPRGGWKRWVEKDAGVPLATADHYVTLFRAVKERLITLGDIAQAGQMGALRAASDIKQREQSIEATEPDWTDDELDRKAEVEAGRCVVANMSADGDVALLAWAEANDCFVRVDRRSEWGNPFAMPDDGERDEVVGKFAKFYLPYKDGLLSRIPSLRGKVLGCWCHPEECHGHIIAEIVNGEAEGKGSAEQLADQLADVDG